MAKNPRGRKFSIFREDSAPLHRILWIRDVSRIRQSRDFRIRDISRIQRIRWGSEDTAIRRDPPYVWINVYLYFSRLRFDPVDENNKPIETLSYADRILADSSGQSSYQSPSYKDSFLRQYQTNDFQQRTILCYLRTNILNLLHTLYVDPSINKAEPASPTPAIHMPDEQVFNALKTIINDFDQCTKCLTSFQAITPCELQSIIELELYKSIPLFIQILLEGLILNKPTEAASTIPQISLSNTTIHFDKIEQYINGILKQLERSYQSLLKD